jgi:acyl dehydratase
MYCAITWDFARLHYDPQFVQKFGLNRPAVDPQMHGAFAARMLSDWISDSGRIRRLILKYQAPCYLGDTITYGGVVANKCIEDNAKYIECDLTATNEKGEQPMVGTASILIY